MTYQTSNNFTNLKGGFLNLPQMLKIALAIEVAVVGSQTVIQN